jgi:hypothetical protein
MDIDRALLRLVSTYQAGRLVPFIGSGMSRRVCTDWETFIEKLEDSVGKNNEANRSRNSRDDLIRRANNAVRELKAKAQPACLSGQSVTP